MTPKRKSKLIPPTPAELRLLEVLWRLGKGTIEQIIAASESSSPPNYKTAQTLLRIMEGKNLIEHSVEGRAFVYEPLVQKEEVNKVSISSFVDRYFRGSRAELLVNLLDDERIRPAELRTLEAMIRQRRIDRGAK